MDRNMCVGGTVGGVPNFNTAKAHNAEVDLAELLGAGPISFNQSERQPVRASHCIDVTQWGA